MILVCMNLLLKRINGTFALESVMQISARSLGEENVQLIMESLGGGGHSTMAAAQIKDSDELQAKQLLLKAIDEYLLNK